MTRTELISKLVASSPHLRVEDAELIVATVFDQITAALARGERVELRGFGATVKQRNARIGRNPRTGETVHAEDERLNRTEKPDAKPRQKPPSKHQRLHRPRRQRPPAGDGAGALSCLRAVGDAREAPPQLDPGREFAALLVDGADGSLVFLGDGEHRWSMGTHPTAGNARGASRCSAREGVLHLFRWREPKLA